MLTSPQKPATPTIDRQLTPESLVRDFGARAIVTRESVRVLYDALELAGPTVLNRWRSYFGQWAGRAIEKTPQQLAKLAKRYHIVEVVEDADALLFALQTYYALVVDRVACRLSGQEDRDLLPGNPFSWYSTSSSKQVHQLLDHLTGVLAGYRMVMPTAADDSGGDWFKPLYQDLFPRMLRHALGEYYTPDWLARHVLDQVGYTGQPDQRLLDPACGSGTFLVMALRRLRKSRESSISAAAQLPQQSRPLSTTHDPRPTTSPIVGIDLNPLAVLTARANYLIAVADLLPELDCTEIPVYLGDSILGEMESECFSNSVASPFDFVVGNPPWIAWDNLPEATRQATKPLWQRYGLFSLSGNEARHGGGKKDLSMLMLYTAADRYLKPGGRLGMVITQTVFQSKGAGDGFRRFRLGTDGPPLGVLRVDDFVALRPFGDASNRTSTIVLQKGETTEYPVRYVKWKEVASKSEIGNQKSEIPNPSPLVPCLARPIDPTRPSSPWLVLPDDHPSSLTLHPSDYTAHLGANSGGANGVYWVEVLGTTEEGVRVRNIAARGKRHVDTVETAIEADLLYPLLRWSDVGRYRAVPRGHIVLSQDPATRAGIAENMMRERYPRTLAYFEQFHAMLIGRAAYRRYQGKGPFYSMYNVGPYTVAPIKVVWRRMDQRINAAVVELIDDPLLGRRPVVPQETCVLVACDTSDEAHYVCAVLNSAVVGALVSACSVQGGKGFGTPGILDYIPLRRFRPDDPRYIELSTLSRKAHAANAEDVQQEIDRLAETLWKN